MHALTDTQFTTNRMWSVRGDVIRGIVFSDSQREFPDSYCHNSDQTHGDRQRDTKRERERKGNVLSHRVTDDGNCCHKPTCHLGKTDCSHTQTLSLSFFFLCLKVWMCVLLVNQDKGWLCLISHWKQTSGGRKGEYWRQCEKRKCNLYASSEYNKNKYIVGRFLNVCKHVEKNPRGLPPTNSQVNLRWA